MAFVEIRSAPRLTDNVQSAAASKADEIAVICRSPEKLRHVTAALRPGSSVHYVSRGDWSMHDLVMELLKTYSPADLYISTYAIRETPTRQLVMAMNKGLIKSIRMLLDYRAKVRTPEVFQFAQMNMTSIYLLPIHAKVCVIKAPNASISIIGSANWTTNPKVEAGVVTMDEAIADFHIDWMNKITSNVQIFK